MNATKTAKMSDSTKQNLIMIKSMVNAKIKNPDNYKILELRIQNAKREIEILRKFANRTPIRNRKESKVYTYTMLLADTIEKNLTDIIGQ